LIIEDIVTQHAEEAAFLWLLRDIAVSAPHYSLADLSELDNRVEAHLDGLRIAGEAGWEICKEALSIGEVGEVFAAAVLAFESGDNARIQEVLKVGSAAPELSRGIVSALGWLPYQQAEKHIKKLLTAEFPYLRRIGIAACAVHRQDPGTPLIDALSDADSLLRARALRAVGQLGRVDLMPLLRDNLIAEDEMCRFSAAWSSALLGDAGALSTLKSFIRPDVPYQEEAVKMALRRMDISTAHGWQKELAQSPDSVRLAVIGAGVIGDPVLITWLIEQMNIPELSRVAGEAFTMITGVDIAYQDLEGEWPEGFEARPTESPEDEDVEMDPDEDLPWPNPELILGWWSKNKSAFRNGIRYLLGQPISPENLQRVLRTGRQRQRAAAAIELAMIKPGQPLFEVRAPGFRQKQILGLK
jgi:uncharacterized protein (TIGR02270 family)